MTLTIDIEFIDKAEIQRRSRDGMIFDIIDYPFQVRQAQVSRIVKVGVTGVWHDPAGALGIERLTQDELIEAARAWLTSRIEKGECDPLSELGTDLSIDLPSTVMEYWVEHRQIPSWI